MLTVTVTGTRTFALLFAVNLMVVVVPLDDVKTISTYCG